MSCSLITSQNADISALAAAACTLHTHSRFLQLIQPAFTALMVPRSRRKGRRVGGRFSAILRQRVCASGADAPQKPGALLTADSKLWMLKVSWVWHERTHARTHGHQTHGSNRNTLTHKKKLHWNRAETCFTAKQEEGLTYLAFSEKHNLDMRRTARCPLPSSEPAPPAASGYREL